LPPPIVLPAGGGRGHEETFAAGLVLLFAAATESRAAETVHRSQDFRAQFADVTGFERLEGWIVITGRIADAYIALDTQRRLEASSVVTLKIKLPSDRGGASELAASCQEAAQLNRGNRDRYQVRLANLGSVASWNPASNEVVITPSIGLSVVECSNVSPSNVL
jgi:hypothetical protein